MGNYNQQNQQVRRDQYNAEGNINQHQVRGYNQQGQQVQGPQYNAERDINQHWDNHYQHQGNVYDDHRRYTKNVGRDEIGRDKAGRDIIHYEYHQAPIINVPQRKPDPVPVRVARSTILSLFVGAIVTFVLTFIIKIFTVVITGFSIFASLAGKSNPDPSAFFANFGQIANFSNPLPLVIGIIAGVLAAILTVLVSARW